MNEVRLERNQGLADPKLIKKIKIAALALIVLAVLGAGYYFIFGRKTTTTDQTQTVTVSKGTISPNIVVSGMVGSENKIDLNFKVSGTLKSVSVKVGEKVKAGQELAQIDTKTFKKQLRIAEANLASSKAQMRQLKKSTTTDVAIQEIAVDSAQKDAAKAQADQNRAQTSTNQAVVSAQTAVDNAKVTMDRALVTREEALQEWQDLVLKYEHPIYHLPNYTLSQQSEVDAAKSAADSALDKYLSAKNSFTVALQNLDSAKLKAQSDLASGESSASKAQAQFQTSELTLQGKTAGPTTDDKIIQKASLVQAEENYKDAELNLDEAMLVSPIDGTVLAINNDVNEDVFAGTSQTTTSFITIADMSHLTVIAQVDQADIPKVRLGQKVGITMDALPDESLKGKVTSVSADPQTTQNVVTYEIAVSIDKAPATVKLGMGATLTIDLGQKNNVLLVPNMAVSVSNNQKVVQKIIDGQTTAIPVEVGLSDDNYTEIISGLSEGDKIVIGVFQTTSTSQNGSSQSSSNRNRGGIMMGPMGRPD